MDNISKLYADVSKKLYIGTEDKIRGLLSTKEGADKFYNVMKDKGVDLGNHTDYMVGLGHENLVEAKDAPPVGVNTEWNADVDIAKETADESKYQAELAENKLEWTQKQKPFGGSKPFGRVELGVNDKVVKSDDGRFLTESGRSYDNFAEANLDQNITDQHKSQTYRLSRMQEQLGEQQEKAGELLEKSKDADSKQFSQALGMGPYYGSMMRHESSQAAAIRKAQADLDDAQEALNELYRQRAEGGDTNYFKNGVDFFVNLGKGEFKKAGESFVKGVNDQTTTLSRVGRGFKDVADDLSNWDFGMTDARNEGTLLSAILKRDNGQSLTEQEQFMLDAAALRAGISSEVGDLGLAYTAGNVTAGSLPFMIEMMANPLSGLGKGATKALTKYAVKKYGREAVKNNMKKYLATKAATRVTGDIVGSLGMTATSGFAGTAANAAERQIGSVQTAYDENGNIVYGGHVGGEDAVTAWAKAGLDRTFENWSEMSGAYFAALGAPIKAVIGKGIGRIVPDKVLQSDFAQWATKKYGDLKNSKFYKGVDAVKSRAQIGGLFEEYLEEKYGDLMRLSIGDTTFDTDSETGIFNLERNVETLVSLIPTQVGFGMLRLGGARTANYQYRQQRNAADKYLEGVLGEDWKGFRSQLDAAQYDPASIAQIYTSMNQVGESNLPMNVRRAVMSYINAQQSVLHSDPALYQSRVNNVDVEETDGKITAYDKDAQGNILSSKAFETREEADAYAINRLEETRDDDMHRFMQTARGLDMLGYNQLSEQFMQERGYDNMTEEEQAEFLDEMSSGRGKVGKAWTKYKVKAIENNMSGTNFAISSWEQAHGLEPGTIEDILDRKPTERTIEESNILTEAYGMLHDLAHPQGKVHVDQSRLDGIKFADEANLDAVLGTSEEEAAEVQPKVDIPAEMKAKRDVATNIAFNTLSNDTDMLTLFGEAMDMNGADAETVIGALSSMDERTLQNTLLDVMNEGVHNERFQSIVDAVNAQTAYDAFVQRTGEKIDERANRETNRRIFNGSLNGSRRTEKPTILTATDGEHTYQITNSTDDITTDENGSVTSQGVITAIDENGNVAVFKGSPSLQITGEEESSTYEEIMRQNLQESVSEIIEPTTEEEVVAENATETQSQPSESADLGEQPADVAGQNEVEEQVPSEEQAPQPTYEAESKMVYDEKGNEAYDRMPIADTMEDLLDGQLEDEQVAELIDNNIEAYEKEIAKLNEKKPKKTTSKSEMIAATNKLKADRAEAERKLKYWQDVKSELAKITHTTEEEVKAVEDELNATEETDASNMPSDAMSLASLFISDAKITPESFRGETGYSTAEQKKFMGIIATQAKGGKTITELAEELVALDNSEYGGAYFGGDTNNARNEIISALQAAETRADLKANARTNADVAKQDYARRRDEAYLDEYGMTYEEYVASEETSLKDAIRNEAGVNTAALHAESEEAKSEAEEAGTTEDAPQEQAPTAEETENARREPLRQKAREWSEKTGVDVVLLESIDDVESDYVRNQIIEVEKRNQQVKGWFDDGSDRVFIYMPHAESEADVEATFVHEVVSHKGLRELLGKSAFDSLCDNVWDMMSEDAKRDFLAYVGVNDMNAATVADKRAAADEYIAQLAERTDLTDAEKSVWDSIVKMIRTALETLGLSISITDDVLSNLIKASYAEMVKNNRSEESVDENKGSEKQGVRFSVKDIQTPEALNEVNDRFNTRLTELDKDRQQKDRVLHLGRPSKFLLDGGIIDAEILMEFDKYVRKSSDGYKNDHPFLADDIMNLPIAINTPIAVFDSTNGRDKVILTELKKDGKNFIVAIKTVSRRGKGGVFLEINDIATLYPKKAKGIVNWINNGLLTNVDKDKALEWLGALRTNHGTELNNQELDSAAKILEDFDNPKLSEGKSLDKPRFRIANNNQEVFVSNAEQAVKGIKQEKATPQQWKAMIQSKGGLKAGEDKWLGLSEWLDEQATAKRSLTKQEVLDFIGENKIRIEEVEYGDANGSAAFASLKEEYDQWLREEGSDYAWGQLTDRYGDDAEIAFWDLGGELAISNEEAATALLGENVINSTRLEYTTEGLENKREIALTVPTIESWNENDDIHFGDAGDGRAVAWARFGETVAYETVYDVQEVTEFHEPYKGFNGRNVYKPVGSFKSGDLVVYGKGRDGSMIYVVYINNKQLPVAHATLEDARNAMNEYYKENPRKLRKAHRVLVIDEIQSKRHQEGREKGYRGSFKVDEQKAKELRDELSAVRKRKKDIVPDEITGIIERAAYRKSLSEDLQAELRSLEAREQQITMEIGNLTRIPNGIPDAPFDKNWHELAMKRMLRLAAEEGFDKVAWTKGAQQAERYNIGAVLQGLKAYKTHANKYYVIPYNNGAIGEFVKEYTEQELADTFGKELAQNIITNAENATEETPYEIEGEDLRIGGEGMKGFYDDILPRFMNKYGKKWGVKVGEVELPELEEADRTMWSVDVTPEMKESVMEGQVMFRKNTLNNNGEGESTQELFLSLQNKEGEEYNDTVNEIADRIVSGRARVGREDLQGRHGTQTQVSATGEIISADRGRVSETVQQGSDASEESTRELIEKSIEDWARQNGVWMNEDDIKESSFNKNLFDEGGENRVYLSEDKSKVTKLLNPYERSSSVLDGLRNISVFNALFPDAAYNVVGYLRDELGMFRIVMEQPFIQGNIYDMEEYYDNGIESKVRDMMENIGLQDEWGDGLNWYNEKYYVRDTHFGNVIEDKEGEVHIIDANAKYNEKYKKEIFGENGFEIYDVAEDDVSYDKQGNPIDSDGTLILEEIRDVNDLTDEDFNEPIRSVVLPVLPELVDTAIGANGKRVIIKKNIFEKNKIHHKELSPADSRDILKQALYNPSMYGQNQKVTRPYNWLLIHVANKNKAVLLEVNSGKDYLEIINWHYLSEATLRQKERQAIKEGGRILTLASAAGNTLDDLSSERKDTENNPIVQENSEKILFRTVKSEYADKVDDLNKGIEEKGLREHLGEVPYKKMMREVYEGNDEIAQNASAMLQDKEWNLYDSIETYLADEAQTMGNEEMWQDVRQSLADAIDFFPSIKDTKYAMWLNKNRDNDPSDPNDGIKRNALLYKLEREERETPVRFRTTPTPVADQAARAQYEAALKRLGYRWSEQWIDGTRSVSELQKAMFGKDFHLADSRDAHEAEKAMTSKIMQKQQRYHKHLVEPLGKAIEKCMKDMPGKSRKKRYENLKKYMYALHGLERNRYIHVRDFVDDEQQLEDYVQYCIQQRQKLDRGNIDITTYFGNLDSYIRQNIDDSFDADKIDKSGIRGDFPTDADALMYIVDTETRLEKERVTELWRRIRDIDDFSLETEYQAGLISGELKAKLASMYGWYIPLRGFEEETAEEAYDYVSTSERAVGGPTVMGAKGRKSKADDPIATMLSIGSQAIHRAERNEVKKKFYRAAKDYMKQNGQGGLVSELFVWEAKVGTDNQGNDIYEVQFPNLTEGMSADEAAKKIAEFEAQMKDLADKGEARQVRQGMNLNKAFENKKSIEEHVVKVYENGQVHLLYINGNPRAAQSLNGTLKTNSNNVAIKAFRKLQRAISQMMTSLNPTFALVSNPIRDYQTALMNTLINDGVLAGGKFMLEHAKSFLNLGWSVMTFGKGGYARMFSLYKEGKLDMSKEEHRLFKEFADNGGITGFIESSAIEDYKDMMNGMLRTRKLPTLKRFVDKANGVLSVPNELMENMARFATYKAARKRGLSVQKSVKRAKDYSLNFNQRGLANGEGWIGSLAWAFNFCYLFVNPTMQAFGMMLNNFKNHPAKTLFYQFALPPMMASMIVPVLNIILASWLDDDDDDDIRDIYGTMPEWKRRNNICLYAGNGNWITIPLPIELRAFYGIGETLASELCGDTEMGKALGWDKMKSDRPAGWQIFDLLMTLTPTSIVYSGGGVDDLGDAFVMTLPQVLKPIGELVINQKWTGAPIWNDASYVEHSPEWQKAYSNTNPYIVEFCRWLNETTGGDEVKPGSININPAKIDHLIQGYFGGLYKSLSEVSAIGKLIVSGNADAIRAEQMPLLKAVWYNYDEAQQSKRYNALFHKYKEEAEQTKAWMRGYEDRGDVDKLMKLLAEPRYERMLLINSYNSERQKFSAGIRKSHAREEENTEEVYKRIRMLGDKAIVEALDKIK